nr:ribosomal protein L13 family protein [Tanacetum cinerariifolium]
MSVAAQSFNGNLKKAVAGIRRINLEGLRWRVFDAKGQVLGRLASQIATVVQGKDKPTYTPNRDDGDMCVILNAKDICVTGRKLTDKFYRWHTGYVGHLKERSLKDQMSKDPTEVIRKAVIRMLPRNKLRDDRDRKLRIFPGSEHPFGDKPLEPYVMPPRQVRELRPRARRAMIRAQKKSEQQGGGNIEKICNFGGGIVVTVKMSITFCPLIDAYPYSWYPYAIGKKPFLWRDTMTPNLRRATNTQSYAMRAKNVSAIPTYLVLFLKKVKEKQENDKIESKPDKNEKRGEARKEKFLNNFGIGSWFTEIIQATSSFENDERIVWISIEGLPIKAWTPNTFRKIASLWGEQKVIIQGKVYWISVKELDAWFLNFQEDDQDDLSSDEELQEGDVANKVDNNESN